MRLNKHLLWKYFSNLHMICNITLFMACSITMSPSESVASFTDTTDSTQIVKQALTENKAAQGPQQNQTAQTYYGSNEKSRVNSQELRKIPTWYCIALNDFCRKNKSEDNANLKNIYFIQNIIYWQRSWISYFCQCGHRLLTLPKAQVLCAGCLHICVRYQNLTRRKPML